MSELVATREQAAIRAAHIRAGIGTYLSTLASISTAYAQRDWSALGYESWDAYVDGEYSEHRLKLTPEHRQKAVAELRLAGMSTRAIGSALGVDAKTVRNDLGAGGDFSPPAAPVTGADGKSYASSRPVAPTAPTQDRSGVQDAPGADLDEAEPEIPAVIPGAGNQTSVGQSPTQLPAGQDVADTITTGIDAYVSTPAVTAVVDPATRDLTDRLAARIDEAIAANAKPAPQPLTRDRDEQTSREIASKNLAKSVWTLAGYAGTVDAADLMAKDWQPAQDIYPKPTTAARMRLAADYLYALAERWPA